MVAAREDNGKLERGTYKHTMLFLVCLANKDLAEQLQDLSLLHDCQEGRVSKEEKEQ